MDALSMNAVHLTINNRKILSNLSMNVPQGDAVTIMGPNGAGKTTLLKVALGLVKPTSGELYFFGKKGLSKESQKLLGYIPQNLGLVNGLSVYSNVMMGALRRMPRWRSITGMYPKDLVDDTYSLMYDLKISHLKDIKIKKLSGGEKQRVAIARTLIQKPLIILADEMTASLDFKAAVTVMEIFSEIKKKMKITLLMTHHNPDIARLYSDNVLIMMNGRIEKNIPANEITADTIGGLYEP
ncbi:ATP-binding cassette domain-containing protein [Candidatus Nitrosotenuis chungbukensis]|uniref:phosphonate ABC transporter ATP-binding protein n=1 Tax=Candidatus Nitrosotenuis chungbukensis TaxID=1353246 RepID=UPI00267373C6|nr:ATP-binding cassette domain-containing protein [Candidatus Nitrosotenuis chungbukensis]WKT58012.1 ATP-binding cassette domain-containing protein [Candidatus Nitrosotenuis chungbukensis]